MIINSINNISTIKNYTKVKRNQQQTLNKNTQQNKDFLAYPQNYVPSFGLFSKKTQNTTTEISEETYNLIKEEIRKNKIKEISDKYHLSFEEAEKLSDGFFKVAFIQPNDDNEIGFNSIIGHNKQKYKLAVDFVTPLVAAEKELKVTDSNVPNGVLLYGIPGSGKTYMTKKTCEHLEYFGVNIENIKFSPNHQKNAEIITKTFEKAKERFINTGKYTVINFIMDIDNYFMNNSLSPKTDLEQAAFMNCSSNCAKDGATWICTSNYPRQLNTAILMPDRAEIKIPVGKMENYAIPDLLKYSLIKSGQKMYIKDIDFQKIFEVIENDYLSFTPAEINEIVAETINKKIHPDIQLTTEDLIKEMHNYNEIASSEVQPDELVGLRQDKNYVDSYNKTET